MVLTSCVHNLKGFDGWRASSLGYKCSRRPPIILAPLDGLFLHRMCFSAGCWGLLLPRSACVRRCEEPEASSGTLPPLSAQHPYALVNVDVPYAPLAFNASGGCNEKALLTRFSWATGRMPGRTGGQSSGNSCSFVERDASRRMNAGYLEAQRSSKVVTGAMTRQSRRQYSGWVRRMHDASTGA